MSRINTYFSRPIFDPTGSHAALETTPRHHDDDGKTILVIRAGALSDIPYILDDKGFPTSLVNKFHDRTIKVTTNPTTAAARAFADLVPEDGKAGVWAIAPRGFEAKHAAVVAEATQGGRGKTATWTPVSKPTA